MKLRPIAFAVALAFTTTSLTSFAAPDTGGQAGQDEGRTRFQRGIELYKEGNYHAALAEFRAANAAAPSSRIQFNLGQTLFQLQDYAAALTAFEAYESEGRDKIPEERLREVDADIVKLRQRVATIKLVVPNAPASGITVTIDDEARTISPERFVRVSAGRRKVAVTASGFQTETRAVDVAGSSVVEMKFELKPVAMSSGEAKPPGSVDGYSPAEGSHKSRVPLYIALGATAAFGATAITLAVLAGSKHGKYDDAAKQPNPDRANLDSLKSATKSLALGADIFGGVAIAAGLTSVILGITTSGGDDRKSPAQGVRVQPQIGLGSAGVTGTF